MRRKFDGFVWERISETENSATARAKVIGGWLVHATQSADKKNISTSMQFVSDKDHEWIIVQPTTA